MSSPRRGVLDAASGARYPLTKAALLDRLEQDGVDADVVGAVSVLGDDEFRDVGQLERALDMAFGMPDAEVEESVLESEAAHTAEPAPRRTPPAGDDATWVGGGRDLTVGILRDLLSGLDESALVAIELDDPEVSEPLVAIAVRVDDRTSAVVIDATWLNSA